MRIYVVFFWIVFSGVLILDTKRCVDSSAVTGTRVKSLVVGGDQQLRASETVSAGPIRLPWSQRAPPKRAKTCAFEGGCCRRPCFGPEDGRAVFCSRHRGPHDVDLINPSCQSPVGCRRSAVFGGEDTGWTRVFCRMHRGENQTNLVLRAKPERSRPRLNKTSVAGAQNNFVPCSHVNEVRCRQGRATLGLMVRELKKPPEG